MSEIRLKNSLGRELAQRHMLHGKFSVLNRLFVVCRLDVRHHDTSKEIQHRKCGDQPDKFISRRKQEHGKEVEEGVHHRQMPIVRASPVCALGTRQEQKISGIPAPAPVP